MTVTAIVPVDKRKCKVFLGEDFAFVLYKSEAARFHIEEENELSEQTYEKIKRRDPFKTGQRSRPVSSSVPGADQG